MPNPPKQPEISPDDTYLDRHGHAYFLKELDDPQRELIRGIRAFAGKQPDWAEFENWWQLEVHVFYEKRGLSRREITHTTAWRIAQDLSSRIGLKEGWMRGSDYRDDLNRLIASKFKTRREFCAATGLSEDMLSHVIAKRKNLGIETLTEALNRIGYTLHIAPLPVE